MSRLKDAETPAECPTVLLTTSEQVEAGRSTRAGDGSRRAGDFAWLVYLSSGLAFGLLYLLLARAQSGWYSLFALVACSSPFAILFGVRRHRPQLRQGWVLVSSSLGLICAAEIGSHLYGSWVGTTPFPSLADPVFLLGYVLLAVALVLLARSRGAGRGSLLDAGITASPAGAILCVFVLFPIAGQGSMNLETVTALAYPVSGLVLLGGALRLVFGRARHNASTRLLIAGMAILLTSDGYFAVAMLNNRYHHGGLIDFGWLVASLLLGAAALHPSMVAVRHPGQQPTVLPAGRLTWLVGACLGCPLVALLWNPHPSWVLDAVTLAIILVTALRAARPVKMLARRAARDDLTGLANRASLLQEIGDALASLPRGGARVAVLFCDLDHFKLVNDSFGHAVGDRLLVEIAGRLRRAVREGDMVARLGGDEFVVLLAVPDDTVADQLAERLAQTLAAPIQLPDGTELYPSMSIGVRTTDDSRARPEDLLRDADTAMYRAKSAGRRRAERFDDRYRAEALETLRLEADLRHGVATGQLFCVYQPEIDLITGALFGFEALVRWRHPTEGVIGPDRFVPVAEASGLVGDLFAAVLEEVLTDQERWSRALGYRPTVGVNLSPVQLSDEGVVETVISALDRHSCPPEALLVEVTETGLADSDAVSRTLGELRRRGVRIAVDDFGTGYSSLARISGHPWDALKIDCTFVSRVAEDEEMRALVAAMVAMAHALGMLAIAEGVETVDQLKVLRSLGCDIAQGYLLARPLDADSAERHASNGWPRLAELPASDSVPDMA